MASASATPVTTSLPTYISWFTFLVLLNTEMQFLRHDTCAFRLSLGHHPFSFSSRGSPTRTVPRVALDVILHPALCVISRRGIKEDALSRLDRGDELESMLLQVLQSLQATLDQDVPPDPTANLEDEDETVDIAMQCSSTPSQSSSKSSSTD
ncbi:hypothetical protein EDD22DRAFT_956757 [Suillus occidentalis]|nr:hypothetical protein EDD22DRAFT_956757 [Suillus occidentalis]